MIEERCRDPVCGPRGARSVRSSTPWSGQRLQRGGTTLDGRPMELRFAVRSSRAPEVSSVLDNGWVTNRLRESQRRRQGIRQIGVWMTR